MNVASAFSFLRIPGHLVVITLFVLSSCVGSEDPEPPALPHVSAMSPTSGIVNTAVVITGTNFRIVLAENNVTFNGKETVVTAAMTTQLTVARSKVAMHQRKDLLQFSLRMPAAGRVKL